MLHIFQRGAGTVGRANQSADTGAGHGVDGNSFVPENAEHADMRNASGKTAGQSQANARAPSGNARIAVRTEGNPVVLVLRSHTLSILRCWRVTKRPFDREDAIL
jgi:hypothetical protein